MLDLRFRRPLWLSFLPLVSVHLLLEIARDTAGEGCASFFVLFLFFFSFFSLPCKLRLAAPASGKRGGSSLAGAALSPVAPSAAATASASMLPPRAPAAAFAP